MSDCRACFAKTYEWLDLGRVPLVNALPFPTEPLPRAYPLRVARCPACGTSQLVDLVDPRELFTAAYPYQSGVSATWVQHCRALARLIAAEYPGGLVLDIGSNDGTMLAAGRDALLRMRGVDPASTAADVQAFFPRATQHYMRETFDVILAQNVLGHVADPHGFVGEVQRLLKPDGRFIVEVPYVGDLLSRGAFDTVYHEHVMYWTVGGLRAVFDAFNLTIVDVERLDLHGGSIRVTAMLGRGSEAVDPLDEAALKTPYVYDRFRKTMERRVAALWDAFAGTSGTIAAFGASAKGAVFAHAAGLGPANLAYVVDETPAKQGKHTSYGVPIRPLSALSAEPAELIWITPWNFERDIRKKIAPYGGKALVV